MGPEGAGGGKVFWGRGISLIAVNVSGKREDLFLSFI